MARTRGPRPADLDKRPLVWGDLSRDEQGVVARSVSDLSENARERFGAMAHSMRNNDHPTAVSRRERYTAAAESFPESKVSMAQATNRRVGAVERAATKNRKDTESIAGAGWYFDHRAETEKALEGTSVPVEHGMAAAARLSVRAQPEDEKASLKALANAHERGSVTFTPDLVASVPSVPSEMHGKTVPFRQLPADVVKEITRPDARSAAAPASSGVDYEGISRVSMANNIAGAHTVLQQGQGLPDPHKNPKQWGYENSHREAVPNSPEHHEYMMRAADLGSKIRGENNIGQQMFDYHGLRNSNEGILSNEGHTAEDSWMKSVSMGRKGAAAKLAGDLSVTTKKRTNSAGETESYGMGDTRVTPGGAEHAFHHEATVRAAKKLEGKYETEYTVPSRLVQESAWYTARREAPKRVTANDASADTDWNEYRRQKAAETAEPRTRSKQLEMF